jgi:hypothetical protein
MVEREQEERETTKEAKECEGEREGTVAEDLWGKRSRVKGSSI